MGSDLLIVRIHQGFDYGFMGRPLNETSRILNRVYQEVTRGLIFGGPIRRLNRSDVSHTLGVL